MDELFYVAGMKDVPLIRENGIKVHDCGGDKPMVPLFDSLEAARESIKGKRSKKAIVKVLLPDWYSTFCLSETESRCEEDVSADYVAAIYNESLEKVWESTVDIAKLISRQRDNRYCALGWFGRE